MWNSSAIGIYSLKALVRCVFYYVGKAFVLGEGQEQRYLKPAQFEQGYNSDCYTHIQKTDLRIIQVALERVELPKR